MVTLTMPCSTHPSPKGEGEGWWSKVMGRECEVEQGGAQLT